MEVDRNYLSHEWKRHTNKDHEEIKIVIREYYDQLYANKLDNLHEVDKLTDKFLERHKLLKLIYKEIANLPKSTSRNLITI